MSKNGHLIYALHTICIGYKNRIKCWIKLIHCDIEIDSYIISTIQCAHLTMQSACTQCEAYSCIYRFISVIVALIFFHSFFSILTRLHLPFYTLSFCKCVMITRFFLTHATLLTILIAKHSPFYQFSLSFFCFRIQNPSLAFGFFCFHCDSIRVSISTMSFWLAHIARFLYWRVTLLHGL